MRPFPRITEHLLQVDLLLAVGTGLLLPHDAPAADAELVEHMITGQLVRVLDHARLVHVRQQLVAANGAHVPLEVPRRDTLRCVVPDMAGHLVGCNLGNVAA
uniref:Putative secreted peptide n=1 Tax=Anopheles braziliensis TaxID=58242 RepID=A0A2M3ZVR6_9DIPT